MPRRDWAVTGTVSVDFAVTAKHSSPRKAVEAVRKAFREAGLENIDIKLEGCTGKIDDQSYRGFHVLEVLDDNGTVVSSDRYEEEGE